MRLIYQYHVDPGSASLDSLKWIASSSGEAADAAAALEGWTRKHKYNVLDVDFSTARAVAEGKEPGNVDIYLP